MSAVVFPPKNSITLLKILKITEYANSFQLKSLTSAPGGFKFPHHTKLYIGPQLAAKLQ